MKFENMDWILITLVLPIFIMIFKEEVLSFLYDFKLYRNRLIDSDGDPATGEECYIQTSRSSGSFHKILVTEYKFGLSTSKRKVITHQKNLDTGEVLKISYPYKEWAQIIKGIIPK